MRKVVTVIGENHVIKIVYHVALMGSWKDLVKEQLDLLEASGAGSACDALYLNATGVNFEAQKKLLLQICQPYSFHEKITFKFIKSTHSYEFPSMELIQELAGRFPQAKFLYFHTKGVSHGVKQSTNGGFSSETVHNVRQWRKVMEYFTITKWRDCVAALGEADACGVEWGRRWPVEAPHFSGNFWWANGSYLSRCRLLYRSRFDAEYFIGTADPKVVNFFASHENPVLRRYFTEEQIRDRLMGQPDSWETCMFNYYDYFYEDHYYVDVDFEQAAAELAAEKQIREEAAREVLRQEEQQREAALRELGPDLDIFVVYRLAYTGNWREIATEQMGLLVSSGLGDACKGIHVYCGGVRHPVKKQQAEHFFKQLPFSHKITVYQVSNLNDLEAHCLRRVQQTAREYPAAKILHLPNEGAAESRQLTPSQGANTAQHRKLLGYFLVENWDKCLSSLEKHDICGLDWGPHENEKPPYFLGDYWWANGSYLLEGGLTETAQLTAKAFLASGNPSVANLFDPCGSPALRAALSSSELNDRTFKLTGSSQLVYNYRDFAYEDAYFVGHWHKNPPKNLNLTDHPIHIVYHVAYMGLWREIVGEQLARVAASGLGEACAGFHVSVVGVGQLEQETELKALCQQFGFFDKMEFSFDPRLETFEFPSIAKAQEVAKKWPDARILYFHTKGASHGAAGTTNSHYTPKQIRNIKGWRLFMEYFTIDKWRTCLSALVDYDACGVDWSETPSGVWCFAGNFWWAAARHVARCTLYERSRFDCEIFIGTAGPKVKSLMQSGENPRLSLYFPPDEIQKMLLFPPGMPGTPQGIFNWATRFYREEFYQD